MAVVTKDPAIFDIGDYIAKHSRAVDTDKYKNNLLIYKKDSVNVTEFKEVVRRVEQHFNAKFDSNDTEKTQERLRMQHEAITGVKKAISFYKNEITDFLRKENLLQSSFPSYYHSLTDAIYHDLYGLGPLVTWYDYPNSQAAHIMGTSIFFEIGDRLIKQTVEFENIDRVKELVRALVLKDSHSQINEYNPKLEISMEDGSRVTMFVPPLSRQISITFRRFVVSKLTFEDQAMKSTIDKQAISLFRALSIIRPNTGITGPVKSGKSTFLNTVYGERNHDQKIVCVEKHYELGLGLHYPGRPLDELVATEQQLLNLFPSILRTDFIYLIVGELRSVEAELCMLGAERGSMGLLFTFHNTFPVNIPGQIARLILDAFSNRKYESELVRAADNINIIITMEQMEDKSKKVTGVLEVRLDPVSLLISVHEIIRYDDITDTWQYKFDVSEQLLKRLRKNNSKWTETFINELKRLERLSPIIGDTVTYSTESRLLNR